MFLRRPQVSMSSLLHVVGVAGLTLVCSSAMAADPLLSGFVSRISTEAIVIKTPTGEIPLPFVQIATLQVRAKGKLSDLPAVDLPCVANGTWNASRPDILKPTLVIPFPEPRSSPF